MGKISLQGKKQKKWNKLMENIPKKLRCVFKHEQPPRKLKTYAYGTIFTSEITLAKLDKYLAKKKRTRHQECQASELTT